MATYLITGSSRGLGLEFASQLSALPSTSVRTIYATARSETPALRSLIVQSSGRVVFVELETTSRSSAAAAAAAVEKHLDGRGLDVLINNAGVMPVYMTGGIEGMDDLEKVLDVNVVGVHEVTRAFLPLLRRGGMKKVINISSTMGSIAKAPGYPFPTFSYNTSKAALNMLTVQYALQLKSEGFIFMPLSPGWLQTDMGTANADLPVSVGAKAVLDRVLGATQEDNGRFANIHVPGWEEASGPNQYDGKSPPW